MGANDWLVDVFSDLNTTRPSGMGMASIPITAIYTYVDRNQLGEIVVDIIRTLDRLLVDEMGRRENGK